MTMVTLSLVADGGAIEGHVDAAGWCRCALVQSAGTTSIGAETLRHLSRRLLAWLDKPLESPAGQIEGETVFGVVSLSEHHYTLYSVAEGRDLLLLFQGPDTSVVGTLRLKPSHQLAWRDMLKRLTLDPTSSPPD